jgi:transposase
MDIISAYREVGSYRGAAEICATTAKTVKRVVEAAERTDTDSPTPHNYDVVADLVAQRVKKTKGRITAKRLLPVARVAGYTGSDRNFRRLVADEKRAWRIDNHRGRRPGVWEPGDVLAIDWGAIGTLHVFCAVLAWSRIRFIYFADNERSETTLAALAACFEFLGGVPKTVLADRMGCLKGGVVANVVIPSPDYVRLSLHYGFAPDFCEAADPASKGLVENLVGYAKSDLMIPEELDARDLVRANELARDWMEEVNAQVHSEIYAVPNERLDVERELLGSLPQLRATLGKVLYRSVDKLSCVRYASARYSVPRWSKCVSETANSRSPTSASSRRRTASWRPARPRFSTTTTADHAPSPVARCVHAPTPRWPSARSGRSPRRSSSEPRRRG